MSPQQAPAIERLPFIPPEIFLNIMEFFIAEAEKLQTCILWELHHTCEDRSKLFVAPYNTDLAYELAIKERFRNVHLVLQISRATRAMAHRTFIHVPMAVRGRNWGLRISDFNTLVLPKLDCFYLCYPDHCLGDLSMGWDQYLEQVMRQLRPESYALLERIEHTYLEDIWCLAPWEAPIHEVILSLPNIKDILVDVGSHNVEEMQLTRHGGERFIVHGVSRELTNWESGLKNMDLSWDEVWEPFLERGVKLFGCLTDSLTLFMEILITETDISYKYLGPKRSGVEEEEEE
ncbi:hypothetical protein CkaCkLH20_08933 [Colletotrichum karsti]|uniref:F-box domain-containing protein n=1 Tax=Colletotrichum karsti TaxID=1095194 RepID=A0A9P6HZT7_9PEZI|nr:uncharacterized protein CkaCkLH20_08933 [Colletotrichum karsti]KAF9873474.1 hypothetical protein CkaCkLH20_08933 [Colletotrichum karsti]